MSNNNLNFLIVEDDPTYAIRLQMLVEELGYSVLETVDNSGRALELIYSKHPDFILMDIEINGEMTGLDIAETIKDKEIPILFITSFSNPEAYQQSENIGAVAFLTKPIDGYSLKSAIRLAVKNMYLNKGKKMEAESNADNFLLDKYLFFKKENTYHKVHIEDIVLLEAEGNGYTKVYTSADTFYMTRSSMSYYEEYLPKPSFVRVHRSYMIQLEKLSSINFFENVIGILGKTIPISRSKQRDLSVLVTKVV